jgi:hypothetical protein
MSSSSSRLAGVSPSSSACCKEQKSLNRLTAKLDKLRKQLAAWQNVMPLYQRHAGDLLPLLHAYDALRAEMVRLLDKAYADKKFTRNEKAKLDDIISSMAADLLADDAPEELKKIYNRHSGGDFDAEKQEGREVVKEMMESMFGVELDGDFELDSPEKLMTQVGEKLQQRCAQEEAAQEQRRKARKKTAKQIAKEEQQHEEKHNVSQSIRAVYRKLVSVVHPDREQDAAVRVRKTSLMQRVNIAYDNMDLLRLLELRLEIEQLDQRMIDTISSERLRQFNKVLREQSATLEQEIRGIELFFRMRLNLAPMQSLSPDMVHRYMQEDIRNIQHTIDEIKNDLMAFRDVKNIKQWLKAYRRRSPMIEISMPFGLQEEG